MSPEKWEFSPDVLDKAQAFIVGGKVVQAPTGSWRVQGSARTPYAISTDASEVDGTVTWATCTCPHGLEQGAGKPWCSHVAAVLMVVRHRHRAAARGQGAPK